MSRDSGGSFFGFMFGLIVGGVLGLLYAPEKGSSTRDKLSFLLDKYRKRLEEVMDELVDGREKVETEARSEGERIIEDAKEKAEELLDDVNGLIDKIKNN